MRGDSSPHSLAGDAAHCGGSVLLAAPEQVVPSRFLSCLVQHLH